MSTHTGIELPRLGRQQMVELTSRARRLGLTPEHYIKLLIEEDLARDRKARSTRFAKLMGPGKDVDEAELDRIVDGARTRHHRATRGKR